MNLLGYPVFAHAGLAVDEHGGVGVAHAFDELLHPKHRLGNHDDVVVPRGRTLHFLENVPIRHGNPFCLLQLLLKLHEIGHVPDIGHHHFDIAVLSVNRVAGHQDAFPGFQSLGDGDGPVLLKDSQAHALVVIPLSHQVSHVPSHELVGVEPRDLLVRGVHQDGVGLAVSHVDAVVGRLDDGLDPVGIFLGLEKIVRQPFVFFQELEDAHDADDPSLVDYGVSVAQKRNSTVIDGNVLSGPSCFHYTDIVGPDFLFDLAEPDTPLGYIAMHLDDDLGEVVRIEEKSLGIHCKDTEIGRVEHAQIQIARSYVGNVSGRRIPDICVFRNGPQLPPPGVRGRPVFDCLSPTHIPAPPYW